MTEPVIVSGPWTHILRDGRRIQVEVSAHSIQFEGRRARFSLVQDVTERQQLHHRLVHQAHHDMLTGLPNRLLLLDRMEQALASAARRGKKAAVMCLDLDRFKQINDTYGHAVGRSVPEAGGGAAEEPAAGGRHGGAIGRRGIHGRGGRSGVGGGCDAGRGGSAGGAAQAAGRGSVPDRSDGELWDRDVSGPRDGCGGVVEERGRGDVPGEALGGQRLCAGLAGDQPVDDGSQRSWSCSCGGR